MYSARFSRLTNPDLMKLFTLIREQKGIKKIPNKTIEYYLDDHAALAKRKYFKFPQNSAHEVVDQL